MQRFRGIAALLCLASIAACGSSESVDHQLAVNSIASALEAAIDLLGAEVRFLEIDAVADGINLYISKPGVGGTAQMVQARFTSERGLVVADEGTAVEGPTFGARDVDFDTDTILASALEQLPSSQPLSFSITAAVGETATSSAAHSAVVYRLVMESPRGGRLSILLSRAGDILGTDIMN